MDKVEQYKQIFYILREMIETEQFESALYFMKAFDTDISDNGAQRIILVATKHFKDKDVIKEVRQSIKDRLELKIGKIY